MEPITRKEMFLAKAAGQSVDTPEPITREEMFLQKIAENGGGGSGGGGTSNAVQYIPQTLTEEQQMQARANMGLYHTEAVEILPETTVEIDPEVGVGLIPNEITVEGGKEYTVKYNGVEYVTTCIALQTDLVVLGNASVVLEGFPSTEEPFTLACEQGEDDSGNPI